MQVRFQNSLSKVSLAHYRKGEVSAFLERRQSYRNSSLDQGGAWPCWCSGSLGQQPGLQLQVFLSSMPPPPASVYIKAKLEGSWPREEGDVYTPHGV